MMCLVSCLTNDLRFSAPTKVYGRRRSTGVASKYAQDTARRNVRVSYAEIRHGYLKRTIALIESPFERLDEFVVSV